MCNGVEGGSLLHNFEVRPGPSLPHLYTLPASMTLINDPGASLFQIYYEQGALLFADSR
jgi:hypothetical protein